MGKLVIFCAGTSIETLPGEHTDAILINVVNNGSNDKSIKKTKELLRKSKAKIVMLDSGGYQLLVAEEGGTEIICDKDKPIDYSGKLNLTPWHVINAAKKICPDVMMSLDFPIRKFSHQEEQEVEFRKKLGFNVTWTKEVSELRQKHCPQISLFVPIQCYTMEQLDIFQNLIKDIHFDGFSMPVRNMTLKEITLFLIRFYQMGIRQVHLLGTFSFFTIALAAYMARHVFDWVSLDATTWRIMAERNIYLNLHNLSAETVSFNSIINENIKNDCTCPWCKGKTFTYIKHLDYDDKVSFLRCHNFWVIENISKKLYDNSDRINKLDAYLRSQCKNMNKVEKLYNILSLMDVSKDCDINFLKTIIS